MQRKLAFFLAGLCLVIFGLAGQAEAQGVNQQALNLRQQAIIPIAAFTARGDLEKLNGAINDGLDAGLSISEVKETLVQMYAYSGFPRSLNGLNTLLAVLEARKKQGIQDAPGREATPPPDNKNPDKTMLELGTAIQTELVGKPVSGAVYDFAPVIDTFLKTHLFGDIFTRDILDFQTRELATIAALASMESVEPQLAGHLNVSLNVGLTPAQLRQYVRVLRDKVGKKEAARAERLLNTALKNNAAANTTLHQKGNGMTANDKVTVERVGFKNRIRIDIAADLYLPKHLDPSKKYAAIIVGHTFTGVKEQTAGLHAQKLAERGYIALAFDASFWGDSGGEPRNIEVPEIRVEDFSAAADFLSNHPLVDARRIGVLGICGGGGYSISAAAIDHRIKAVATISMYDLGRARRQGLGDVISYEQRMKTLERIGELRTKEFRGEPRTDTLGVPAQITENDTENTREFFDYYRTPRAQHPNTDTSYSLTSQAPMMNFFPFAQIETISPRPLLFIVGERAVSAYFSEDAYRKAAEPKELFIIPGASHVDLYDRPEYMGQSLKKLDSFFRQYLGG